MVLKEKNFRIAIFKVFVTSIVIKGVVGSYGLYKNGRIFQDSIQK